MATKVVYVGNLPGDVLEKVRAYLGATCGSLHMLGSSSSGSALQPWLCDQQAVCKGASCVSSYGIICQRICVTRS
jgi:hypothetical protein